MEPHTRGFPGEGTWLEFEFEIGVETISAAEIPTRNLRGYGRGEPNSRCPCYGTEASALAPRADRSHSETIADLTYFRPIPTICGMCRQAISASVDAKLSPDPYPGGSSVRGPDARAYAVQRLWQPLQQKVGCDSKWSTSLVEGIVAADTAIFFLLEELGCGVGGSLRIRYRYVPSTMVGDKPTLLVELRSANRESARLVLSKLPKQHRLI